MCSPVLLYGCENWLLSDVLIDQLNCLLGELAKRALKWPKHHSNTAAMVALGIELAEARMLERKLGFLARRMRKDGVGVGVRVFSKEDEGRWSRGGCESV